MGFACFTAPLIAMLNDATDRGVRVQVCVNSHHSTDLCCPQKDLMLSCTALMRHAPKVELYATFRKDLRPYIPGIEPRALYAGDADGKMTATELHEVGGQGAPTFMHAKFIVADSQLVCAGSWNCWPRSAFYEHECNVLVHAPTLAANMEHKFEVAKLRNTARICDVVLLEPGGLFTPLGCSICMPYGPCLYSDDLVALAKSELCTLQQRMEERSSEENR
jgi:phosphatidylserine/phosphatidylglycerophosphate/cardiolipin synthase-like enzyme